MKKRSLGGQAAVLAGANLLTRGMGFILRVAMGRMLGAQAMGIISLSHSAHMLCIAPLTAGLPMAVSRITAREGDDRALRAGRRMVLGLCAVMLPLWLLLCPLMARWLGDMRTLPALWVFAPCMVAIGLSAVYNGYCYGCGEAWPPALGEMAEQGARLLLTAALVWLLPQAGLAWRAALPGAATALAEALGLGLTIWLLRGRKRAKTGDLAAIQRELLHLALPLCGMRVLTSAGRALAGAMLPRRLVLSGLTLAQATAQLGMLQGMVMPVAMAPGMLSGAIGMVGAPAVAREQGYAQRRMAVQLLVSALVCGGLGMLAMHLSAGLLAQYIFKEPQLKPYLHLGAPLALLFCLQHAVNALLGGLGAQKSAVLPTLCGEALTLVLLYRWTALPALRLAGALRAMQLGQSAALLITMALLMQKMSRDACPAFGAG